MVYWPFLLPVALISVLVDALEPPVPLLTRNGNSSSRIPSLVSAAWYTGWHATDFPLSAVSWSKYTHLTYAFATTTPDVNVLSLTDSDETLLPQFVTTAHQHNVKASLSIGGWTGSRWFSSNVGSAQNRTAFVNTVTQLVTKYNLDGIDLDWEFPGIQGIGCNIVNPNDTVNFLAFIQELRNSTVGKNLILSAATYITPFVDETGKPSTDVSGFSQVLDYIAIMNYDIKSSPSIGAGSSSPLDDSCAPAGAQHGSATSAVDAWTSAKFPNNNIVLGVPAYGHSFDVSPGAAFLNGMNSTLLPFPAYNPNGTKPGDSWDGDGGLDVCGVQQGPGGIYQYWGLIQTGFLNGDGSVKDEISFSFSNCSQTPSVYNASSSTYVTYENAQSMKAKGEFINKRGLRGFATWEAGGDYNDVLLDSIRSIVVMVGNSSSTLTPSPSIPLTTSGSTPNLNSLGSTLLLVIPLIYILTISFA